MFIHFNPNPIHTSQTSWNRGDCVIRSISCAMDWDWKTTYIFAFTKAMSVGDIPNSSEGFQEIMRSLNFKRIICENKKTPVSIFAELHKDDVCICSVQGLTGHVVCCKEGNYYDTFDSGKYCVYGYHIKQPIEIVKKPIKIPEIVIVEEKIEKISFFRKLFNKILKLLSR